MAWSFDINFFFRDLLFLAEMLTSYRALQITTVLLPLLFILFFAILELSLIIIGRKSRTKCIKIRSETILEMISPTRSIWPSQYYRAISKNPETLCFCSETFIEDIINGKLELREPAQDLTSIVKGGVSVPKIVLKPSTSHFMKVLRWIFLNEVNSASSVNDQYHVAYSGQSTSSSLLRSATKVPKLGENNGLAHRFSQHLGYRDYSVSVAPCVSEMSTSLPTPFYGNLDYVPRSKISSYIAQFQKEIRQNKYCEAWLELTTCNNDISFSNGSLVHIALPFLRQRTGSVSPTSAFLFVSLHTILKSLATGPFSVTIVAVQNMSQEKADSLVAYARLLDESPCMRTKILKEKGIKHWREEKFYAYWEAALYRANLLSRWIIKIEA